jgi:NADH-quinone oxidoreductase subunit M
MVTLILILLPLLISLLLFTHVFREYSRWIALATTITEFVVSIAAWHHFEIGGLNYALDLPWLGTAVSLSLGMDGISLMLVLLTTLLVPIILATSMHHEFSRKPFFPALVLLMQAALIGVFTSRDALLFYVFWEMALIPIYFISAVWGGNDRIRITLKFFIYTLAGSLFMLVAIIYLYTQTTIPHNFSISALSSVQLNPQQQLFVFWAFFLAFAVKIPLFPLHTWQPDTYTTAPAAGTMLLAGIMLKMGLYGLLRFILPLYTGNLSGSFMLALGLALTGLLYASVIAIKQKEIKRLFAYSSMAHVGLIAAAIFTQTAAGLQGAVFQMLAHGVNVVGLFFLADLMAQRAGSTELSDLGGLARTMPRFATVFMIMMLASIGLPLTNSFVGEYLMITGLFSWNPWIAALAGLSIILGAIYMLRFYQHSFYCEPKSEVEMKDMNFTELLIVSPLLFLIFWMGIAPGCFLHIIQPAIEQLVR